MTEWQPIETAQKDFTPILLHMPYLDKSENIQVGFYNNDRWENSIDSMNELNPTHWMPLPKPPKKKHCCYAVESSTKIRCESLTDTNRFFDLVWIDGSRLLVTYCPFCGKKADEY